MARQFMAKVTTLSVGPKLDGRMVAQQRWQAPRDVGIVLGGLMELGGEPALT